MRCLALACCLLLLAACSRHGASELPVTLVSQTPLQLDIEAEGRLRAVRATPLQVPGRSWAQQQLIWMVPDGSPALNPAFDVTPARLVTGLITERGVFAATAAALAAAV